MLCQINPVPPAVPFQESVRTGLSFAVSCCPPMTTAGHFRILKKGPDSGPVSVSDQWPGPNSIPSRSVPRSPRRLVDRSETPPVHTGGSGEFVSRPSFSGGQFNPVPICPVSESGRAAFVVFWTRRAPRSLAAASILDSTRAGLGSDPTNRPRVETRRGIFWVTPGPPIALTAPIALTLASARRTSSGRSPCGAWLRPSRCLPGRRSLA